MGRVQVKVGRYNWVRLNVDDSLSYVMADDQKKTLRCPSCGDDNVFSSAKVLYNADTANYEYVAAYLPLDESGAPTP